MGIAFRDKALVKLRSPEQLDEALQVIWQKRRMAFRTFIGVLIVALAWGVFGRLPKTGRGQGILMAPNSVLPIQAGADGQIAEWRVKVGDIVKQGDVLGFLDQPTIERQMEQAQAKLEDVLSEQKSLRALRVKSSDLERQSIRRQREQIKQRADYLAGYISRNKSFADQINDDNARILRLQENNAKTAKKTAEQLTTELEQRVASYERLRAEKLASDDTLRGTRLRFENSQLRQKELDLQEQQLNLARVQTSQAYLDANTQVASFEHTLTQLNLQLQQLDTREAQQTKADSEADIRDRNEVDDLRRSIDRFAKQLQQDREIKAEHAGRVLEITVVEGSVVTFGQRLLQLETRRSDQPLMTVVYFEDKIGKYLEKGMPVRVAPLSLDQKRYGSIIGHIDSVSAYPITPEAAINSVGNQEVASKLTLGGFQIEAYVELTPNPASPSGFSWTSGNGPDVTITSGTTADVWVTYEERAPITFILPKLREWSGLALASKKAP